MPCKHCETFFASHRCNKPEECDCPKCQGICECGKSGEPSRLHCWICGKAVSDSGNSSYEVTTCPACGWELITCSNCSTRSPLPGTVAGWHHKRCKDYQTMVGLATRVPKEK